MGSLPHSSHYTTSPQGTPTHSLKHESSFSSMPSNQLQPTWHGYVADTSDALALFQGAIDGDLRKVVRRPHDRERPDVIRSGAVFIYEESASGIKRWTDGVPWSPSRILGNFLIYRELEKPFPPGEKKRATKKIKSPRPGAPYTSRGSYDDGGMMMSGVSGGGLPMQTIQHGPGATGSTGTSSPVKQEDSPTSEKDSERSLVGSLTDSYSFREGGLVKKTLSIAYEGGHLHLVSYYVPDDVRQNRLPVRSEDPRVSSIQVRPELVRQQNFRAPIEPGDETASAGATTPSSYRPSSIPNQYITGGNTPSSSYVSPQTYGHMPQQGVAHQSPSYHHPMGVDSGNQQHSSYQVHPGYSSVPYADFGHRMPPQNSSPVTPLGHHQPLPPAGHGPLHPDQSSYGQHPSSYQMPDGRSHYPGHYQDLYGGQFKQEWHDPRNR